MKRLHKLLTAASAKATAFQAWTVNRWKAAARTSPATAAAATSSAPPSARRPAWVLPIVGIALALAFAASFLPAPADASGESHGEWKIYALAGIVALINVFLVTKIRKKPLGLPVSGLKAWWDKERWGLIRTAVVIALVLGILFFDVSWFSFMDTIWADQKVFWLSVVTLYIGLCFFSVGEKTTAKQISGWVLVAAVVAADVLFCLDAQSAADRDMTRRQAEVASPAPLVVRARRTISVRKGEWSRGIATKDLIVVEPVTGLHVRFDEDQGEGKPWPPNTQIEVSPTAVMEYVMSTDMDFKIVYWEYSTASPDTEARPADQ